LRRELRHAGRGAGRGASTERSRWWGAGSVVSVALWTRIVHIAPVVVVLHWPLLHMRIVLGWQRRDGPRSVLGQPGVVEVDHILLVALPCKVPFPNELPVERKVAVAVVTIKTWHSLSGLQLHGKSELKFAHALQHTVGLLFGGM
jgi:hypothetical protein